MKTAAKMLLILDGDLSLSDVAGAMQQGGLKVDSLGVVSRNTEPVWMVEKGNEYGSETGLREVIESLVRLASEDSPSAKLVAQLRLPRSVLERFSLGFTPTSKDGQEPPSLISEYYTHFGRVKLDLMPGEPIEVMLPPEKQTDSQRMRCPTCPGPKGGCCKP